MTKDILDLTLGELRAEIEAMGEKPYRAAQVFDWLYKKNKWGHNTHFRIFSPP